MNIWQKRHGPDHIASVLDRLLEQYYEDTIGTSHIVAHCFGGKSAFRLAKSKEFFSSVVVFHPVSNARQTRSYVEIKELIEDVRHFWNHQIWKNFVYPYSSDVLKQMSSLQHLAQTCYHSFRDQAVIISSQYTGQRNMDLQAEPTPKTKSL